MITLNKLFQDGMMLQRNKPIHIWGVNEKEQFIHILWNSDPIWEGTIPQGEFKIELPQLEAFENGIMSLIEMDGKTTELRNVDIGEIWIAGGQSNMQFELRYDKNGDEMIRNANDNHLRYYEVARYSFEGEETDHFKDDSNWNKWFTYEQEHAPYFSAAAVYFAQKLRAELLVPVAIIGCNWGGTAAITWIDEETIQNNQVTNELLQQYKSSLEKINLEKYAANNDRIRKQATSPAVVEAQSKIMKNESQTPPRFFSKLMARWFAKNVVMGPRDENRPAGLVTTMLMKIAGVSCRGVIWYQGESDESHAEIYDILFEKVLESWWKLWGEKLPFLFVQLAPFEAWQGEVGDKYPIIREMQENVESKYKQCWMASIMDVGSRYDIHPKDKAFVGNRLARLALAKIYGKDIECEAPRMQEAHLDGDSLSIQFSCTGGEITSKGDVAQLFVLKNDDKLIGFELQEVKKNCVILRLSEHVNNASLMIEFAYQPYCEMTLYGINGLSARPGKLKVKA